VTRALSRVPGAILAQCWRKVALDAPAGHTQTTVSPTAPARFLFISRRFRAQGGHGAVVVGPCMIPGAIWRHTGAILRNIGSSLRACKVKPRHRGHRVWRASWHNESTMASAIMARGAHVSCLVPAVVRFDVKLSRRGLNTSPTACDLRCPPPMCDPPLALNC